jgi:hypothetical protein
MRADTTHGHGPDRTDPRAPSSTPAPATIQPPSSGHAASVAMVGADGDRRRDRGTGHAGRPRRRGSTGRSATVVESHHDTHDDETTTTSTTTTSTTTTSTTTTIAPPSTTSQAPSGADAASTELVPVETSSTTAPTTTTSLPPAPAAQNVIAYPNQIANILATIRYLESRGNYSRRRTRGTRRAPISSSPRRGPTTAGTATPTSLHPRSRTNALPPMSAGSSPSGTTTSR